MGHQATQNRGVLGIEISHGIARGVRLDVATNEIVAMGAVRLGSFSCDSSDALEPALAAVCLEPLLERLDVTDRSQVDVGIAIGPRHSGVGSGPAMPAWLTSRALRLGVPLTVAGELGISFAPTRAVDAAAKAVRELGLEPVSVDIAPVAAARAYGKQVDGIIRVGSGRGWQARMRNFEVLEAMESATVARDEAMTIQELDGSITRIDGFGFTDIPPSAWDSRTSCVGSMAVAVGAVIGVAFENPTNLLEGTVIGDQEPTRYEDDGLDESTLKLQARERTAPEPMHRRYDTTQLARVRVAPVPQPAKPEVPSVEPARPTPPEPLVRPEMGAESPEADENLFPGPAVAVTTIVLPREQGSKKAAADRPTAEVQMAAMADWQNEALDQQDPINLFSPQTPEEHLRGESTHGFGIPHLLLVLVVLAVVAAGLAIIVL